ETVFLINNLLLTAFTFTVLLGTLFPLVAEALRGVKVSVGAPFFNKMTIPLCAALLFMVGVGPALPWRGGDKDMLKKKFFLPMMFGAAGIATALTLGSRSVYGLLAWAFAFFALGTNGQEFWQGSRARMRAHGENFVTALTRLVRSNNRRYGGYVAHLGVVVMAFGIAASSVFKSEVQATLRPGDTMQMKGYTLRFDKVWGKEEPHRVVIGADLIVLKGTREIGKLDPRTNFYRARNEPVPTPSVRERFLGDLYANLMSFERDGSNATFVVYYQPLVGWIWAGGFIIALGSLIGLMRPRKRAGRAAAKRETETVAA
ncbi:MAG TPA: cytochrome c-type biogenesis CcmF C-terminal domain-containing protein, partial [Longimicrobiales bacterium]